MPPPMTPEELLTSIISSMVDLPGQVRIVRTVDEMGVLLSIHVASSDMGKIIGVVGVTAKAIRMVMRCVGAKYKQNIHIKIVEPGAPGIVPLETESKTSLEDIDKHL